jgi:chemotaxis methyl-accepting protein methylase
MADAVADDAFRRILQTLLEKRGLDFNEYRRSFLQRRLESRLHANNLKDFASYEKILKSNPEELSELFDTLTINVAEFFRDPPVWQFLEREILSPLIKRGKMLRIWSAGCASGEEPYSIAVAVKEITRAISGSAPVKIVASDVDPLAVARARRGIYGTGALTKVSERRLRTFFTKAQRKDLEDGYEVIPEIKAMVHFYEQNYLEPASVLSRADIILCRNSMIYLKTEAKNKAVSNFHRTLLPGGYLILGVTEVLIGESHYNQFDTIKGRPGVFQKRSP